MYTGAGNIQIAFICTTPPTFYFFSPINKPKLILLFDMYESSSLGPHTINCVGCLFMNKIFRTIGYALLYE